MVTRRRHGRHLRRDVASSRQARLKLAHPLTLHDLRAPCITLALEGKAPLYLAQYAAGHQDPRTTEHDQRRQEQLDDHAVDAIHG